jgi:hypothetical protein
VADKLIVGQLTVSVYVLEPVQVFGAVPTVAVTVMLLNVPLCVGVPLNVPLLNVKPVGNVPVNVNVAPALLLVKVWLNDCPVVAVNEVPAGLTVIVGQPTVRL